MTRQRSASLFALAIFLSVVLPMVPYGRLLLYPFALLGTWAHELGHGLTALALGGVFDRLELYMNLGGVAFTAVPDGRIERALVAAGGLLAPAILGALVIRCGPNLIWIQRICQLLGLALLLSAALWIRNVFGFGAAVVLGLGLLALHHYSSSDVRIGIAQMIGVQLGMASVSQLDYMFSKGFVRNGQLMQSDTQAIAEQLLLPFWAWGIFIALLSAALLFWAFKGAWYRKGLQ